MPNRRLVVVESNAEFLGMLAEFLTARRFQVTAARTGDEGLQIIRQTRPQLVLLSRELREGDGRIGPDGLRVLKTLKQDRELYRIPVIFMAESLSSRDLERYRKLRFSAQDYVKKPFEDTDLLRRIENLIGFDLAESVGDLKAKMEGALEPGMGQYFNAPAEELGEEKLAAGRREIADLMAQVGKELERHEQALAEEKPAAAPEPSANAARLRDKIEEARAQLTAERSHGQELRTRWKKALQVLEARWKESEEREARLRRELEHVRARFSDLELDHTMEIERLHQESRWLQEELADLSEKLEIFAELPDDLFAQIREAAASLQSLLQRSAEPNNKKS